MNTDVSRTRKSIRIADALISHWVFLVPAQLQKVMNKVTASCVALSLFMSFAPSAGAGCNTYIDTSTLLETGFENGNVLPFSVCTYESPNYGEAVNTLAANGSYSMKFWWTQVGYDGTRDGRGVEACGSYETYKEGWYGFQFYLPDPGYPKDKYAAIAQIFQNGYCNSWAALLIVRNGALYLQYRDACTTPTEVLITNSIQYNAWKPIIIHWVASQANAGTMQVWYAGDVGNQATPTYSATNINFGFAHGWVGDTLPAGSAQTLKFGQYNFDDGNYTTGETRTNYYDCVSQLVGNPSGAWTTVNPTL